MRLLITGAWNCSEEQLNKVSALGHEIVFQQCENEELPCDYRNVEGVICNALFLYHPVEEFVNLRYVQLTSAGYDRVSMEYFREHGIEVYNARDVYSIPMAESAVAGVLQLYKQSCFFAENQKKHQWEKCRNLIELEGKTLCIVGCGSVGTECARRFQAFGCNILGVNRHVRESSDYSAIYPMDRLEAVLEDSDIVILSLPLTDETRHLFDEQMLVHMKKDAVLVNLARGALIDTGALVRVLSENRLYGAVLDVFEEEPLAEDSPLWDMPNVILTPHNSFVGEGNAKRLFHVIYENLKQRNG